MKPTIIRLPVLFCSDTYWHLPSLSEQEKVTLDEMIKAIPECLRFQIPKYYKELKKFCKEHGKKITCDQVNILLADEEPIEESGDPLVNLLHEWMYEMGSLEQHDYDALCLKTERILGENKRCPK